MSVSCIVTLESGKPDRLDVELRGKDLVSVGDISEPYGTRSERSIESDGVERLW